MSIRATKAMMFVLLASSLAFTVQERRFTRDDIEYELVFPSAAWQAVSRVDVHTHLEFVNGGDPSNGYLRLRKIVVPQPTTPAALFRQDEKWELQRLPGYVVCSDGLDYEGRLSGAVFTYEYVRGGRTMSGQNYYLQIDRYTFYSLRFSVARDKLQNLQNQMDFIALSFHLK